VLLVNLVEAQELMVFVTIASENGAF
jgi:hypothetical protein